MGIDFQKLDAYNKRIDLLCDELAKLREKKFSKFISPYIKYKEKELSDVRKKHRMLLVPSVFSAQIYGDAIKIIVGKGLVKYAESATAENLMRVLAKLRDSMARRWGYIFPAGRIVDCEHLGALDYEIVLQEGAVTLSGTVSEEERADNPINTIIAKLQAALFEYSDVVLLSTDIINYVSEASKNAAYVNNNTSRYSDYFNSLPILYLKRVICELLKARCDIRNINYIIDRAMTLGCYDEKSETDVINILKKELSTRFEALYVSDWCLATDKAV